MRARTARAAVWGLGHIGYSTAVHLSRAGVDLVGYDVDPARIDVVRELERAHGAEGGVWATYEVSDALDDDILVHFVAVPTERGGEPWNESLRDVLTLIVSDVAERRNRPLVIVESTLMPGTTDSVVAPLWEGHELEIGRDLLLGLAPRRDWFVDGDHTLENLDRVYAGVDEASAEATESVLSVICCKLHRASGHRVGELVKCVENAYRHVQITLANQLTLAFPDLDIREALRLAGTKWNIDTFHPSFGTGGYCIPLSSRYLVNGTGHRDALSILDETIATDDEMPERVARAVERRGCRRVAVLGLAYRGNLKVATMSPAIGITACLRDRGVDVAVADPKFTAAEIERHTGARVFDVPSDLGNVDAVLLVTDHSEFLRPDVYRRITDPASRVRLVIDNYGSWLEREWPSRIEYYAAGSADWL